jgi:transcriptional regulator with XRE-family HTH domain
MSATHFGARLRELRQAAGMTQKQLAERSGLHPYGVAKLEQGQNNPRWATVLMLAGALGVVDLRAFEAPAKSPSTKRGRPKTK